MFFALWLQTGLGSGWPIGFGATARAGRASDGALISRPL
jgi:hypothetical protein